MNGYLKNFIEKHIELLDSPEGYNDFFDEVYDRLRRDTASELLKILRAIDEQFVDAAKVNLLQHFKHILETIWIPYHGEDVALNLKYFYMRYMNHLNGLTKQEFEELVLDYMIKNYPHIEVDLSNSWFME